MIGPHQSMPSLNPPLPSNISKTGVSMFSSAAPNIARVRGTAAWSVVILTRVIVSLLGTFASMPRTCWGVETVAAADETGNLGAAMDVLTNLKDGSITEAFQ